jgi:hypothetical protein
LHQWSRHKVHAGGGMTEEIRSSLACATQAEAKT